MSETQTEAAVAEEPKTKRFSDEEVASIRALRAEPRDDDPTKPKYSHAQLAEKFGRTGQQISAIVRNNSHKDENYTPVFDGHRNLGPRERDADGKIVRKVKPEPDPNAEPKKRGRKPKAQAEAATEEQATA